MEVPFALALERGQVLKLRDLNSGFTKPDTIALAYHQASLLVGHIVATRGEPALRALRARLWRRRSKATPRSARGWAISIDELQGTFDKMLDQRFSAVAHGAARQPPSRGPARRAPRATSPR